MPSRQHRLKLATNLFWKHARLLQGRGSPRDRLDIFFSTVGASATFGCGDWTITGKILKRMHRFETNMLRTVFRHKSDKFLNIQDFYKDSNKKLKQLFKNCNYRTCLPIIVIKGYFGDNWRARQTIDQFGDPIVDKVRAFKTNYGGLQSKPKTIHTRKKLDYVRTARYVQHIEYEGPPRINIRRRLET